MIVRVLRPTQSKKESTDDKANVEGESLDFADANTVNEVHCIPHCMPHCTPHCMPHCMRLIVSTFKN